MNTYRKSLSCRKKADHEKTLLEALKIRADKQISTAAADFTVSLVIAHHS